MLCCRVGAVSDFSCTPEELARHNSHDLSSAMGSSFDGVDFYPTDDALRGCTLSWFPLLALICLLLCYRWTRPDRLWRFADTDELYFGNRSIDRRSLQTGSHVKGVLILFLSSSLSLLAISHALFSPSRLTIHVFKICLKAYKSPLWSQRCLAFIKVENRKRLWDGMTEQRFITDFLLVIQTSFLMPILSFPLFNIKTGIFLLTFRTL